MFSLRFPALAGLTQRLLDKQRYWITIPATGARILVIDEKTVQGVRWAALADTDAAGRTADHPQFMQNGPQWVVVDAGPYEDSESW